MFKAFYICDLPRCVQSSKTPFLSVCDRDLKHFTSVLLLSGASANVPHYLPSLFLMHCGRAMDRRSRRKEEGEENEGGENCWELESKRMLLWGLSEKLSELSKA